MDIFEFGAIVQELVRYFERKKVEKDVIELWYQDISHVSSKSLSWIAGKLKERNERFPLNLPIKVRELYNEWSEINPDIKHYRECKECGGDGWLNVAKIWNNFPYNKVFRCSVCRQADAPSIPESTYAELERYGYKRITCDPLKIMSEAQKENLRAMVAGKIKWKEGLQKIDFGEEEEDELPF